MENFVKFINQYLPSTERQILEHCGQTILKRPDFKLDQHEKNCLDSYSKSALFYGLINALGWGYITYQTFDPFSKRKPLPLWLKMYGVVGISFGAFATVFICGRWSSQSCIQCLLDNRDKKSELYIQVRKLMTEHHPKAEKYFEKEKFRLNSLENKIKVIDNPSDPNTSATVNVKNKGNQ